MSFQERERQLSQDFAAALRTHRKHHNMSQHDLAQVIGVPENTVSLWEAGIVPSLYLLLLISDKLGIVFKIWVGGRASISMED